MADEVNKTPIVDQKSDVRDQESPPLDLAPPASTSETGATLSETSSAIPRAGEPFEIAVLALQNTKLFPETLGPLSSGRPRSVAAVEAALSTAEKLIGCITVRDEIHLGPQDAKSTDLYTVGTLAMIKRMERIGDTIHIMAQGTERIKVVS